MVARSVHPLPQYWFPILNINVKNLQKKMKMKIHVLASAWRQNIYRHCQDHVAYPSDIIIIIVVQVMTEYIIWFI